MRLWTLVKLGFAALLALAGIILPPELHWWWTRGGEVDGEAGTRAPVKGGKRRRLKRRPT